MHPPKISQRFFPRIRFGDARCKNNKNEYASVLRAWYNQRHVSKRELGAFMADQAKGIKKWKWGGAELKKAVCPVGAWRLLGGDGSVLVEGVEEEGQGLGREGVWGWAWQVRGAMFGEAAAELVRELKGSKWLLPFNESAVRNVAAETKSLMDMILTTVADFKDKMDQPEVLAAVFLFHRSVQRNKRCGLAYLYKRLERLKALRWEYSSAQLENTSNNLSDNEKDFLTKYNQLLGEYCETVGLDLTAEFQPPKDLYIEVRVVRECGTIVTDSGSVNLKTGTAHFLPRADVEHLVRQGALEHIV